MTLRSRDLRAVLSVLADAHRADGPEAVNRELLDRLAELLGCEYATYETFDWPRRLVTAYIPCSNEDSEAVPPPYYPERFWTSPHWLQKTGAAFRKLSDVCDRRERERIRDEDPYNAEFRIVDTMALRVGDMRTRSAHLRFESQRRDFDERDRELTVTLRPHVDALWRRSISRRQVVELAAALERGGDGEARQAIVVCEVGGRIEHATGEAPTLLTAWFGTTNGHLPRELHEWLTIAAPGDRYTKRRNGSILTVETAGDFTLTLGEQASQQVCLTPRERDVLGLVAEGFTNVEIARRLWVAPSTVAKHLEQAYSKLGVHSRTAAVARLAKLRHEIPA
ncbi:MAG TPA: LuxR C-terminal-related transcriptional regulator [Gaiellaceae bacterium]